MAPALAVLARSVPQVRNGMLPDTESCRKTFLGDRGVSPVTIAVFRQICTAMAVGRTGARKGRRQASRGIPKKRLGLVDADVVDRLDELCGELGVSRDAFTTMVLREGLRVMTAQDHTEESLMAS